MKFNLEREGQEHFYKNYLPLVDKNLKEKDILQDYTDGVVNGNIIEFKLNIDNLNKVLFQAIKYLSKMRINGQSIPKNILLISLNESICYRYDSDKYLSWIEKQYFSSASVKNENFIADTYDEKISYDTQNGSFRLIEILRENKYIKIHIDETSIVGWTERYYKEVKNSNKGDFIGDIENKVGSIGEIRDPIHFKNLIYPYEGETNEKFAYLLDKLNDKITQKETGAFYTPTLYAKKAYELIEIAIKRVPKGNDYVIFDFCAGTGNLEEVFPDEILSHCILSTYEYYEYRILSQKLADKVRYIIPPTESMVKYRNGFVKNADAMDKEFIKNPVIEKYVNDSKTTIIMYENPPYRDSSSADKKNTGTNESFVYDQMKKDLKTFKNSNISTAREFSNRFIYRAFKFYLRDKSDSYIVFSPVKYFKSLGLINKKFIKGFAFNRKHFHASESVISCILWNNEEEKKDTWELEAYDIKDNKLHYEKNIIIKEVNNTFEKYFDRRSFEEDTETNIFSKGNGYPKNNNKEGKSYNNDNIIGYLRAINFPIAPLNLYLTRTTHYGIRGFYLRDDNYIEKLPLFAAKLFPTKNWYEKDVYFTTSDKKDDYIKDKDLLKASFIYTSLSNKNKCISFIKDNIFYKNELCFDNNTKASKDLKKFNLNEDDKKLLNLWKRILENAKLTKNYNKDFTYGTYQINEELNTFTKDKNNKKIYDYKELNGDLISLKNQLKLYYNKYIKEKLLKYELVK